jgi:hypothetical protein
VAEFQDQRDCDFAVHLLSEGGILTGVLLPERRLDLRGLQIRVAPDDEQAAREILARPVSAAKRTDFDAEQEGAPFALPLCPACTSTEVILETATNVSSWRCDLCGNRWTEMPDIPEDGR